MNLNFRSSLHGFNRQDVANYLEYLNNRHAAQVNQLNTDLEALRRQAEAPAEDPQRTALEARCRELEQQLEAARKERDEALAQREAAEQKLASARAGPGGGPAPGPAAKSWRPTGSWKPIAGRAHRAHGPGAGRAGLQRDRHRTDPGLQPH